MLESDPLYYHTKKLCEEQLPKLEHILNAQQNLDIIELETKIRLLLINSIEEALDRGYKKAYTEALATPSTNAQKGKS